MQYFSSWGRDALLLIHDWWITLNACVWATHLRTRGLNMLPQIQKACYQHRQSQDHIEGRVPLACPRGQTKISSLDQTYVGRRARFLPGSWICGCSTNERSTHKRTFQVRDMEVWSILFWKSIVNKLFKSVHVCECWWQDTPLTSSPPNTYKL